MVPNREWLAAYSEAGTGIEATKAMRRECRLGFGEVESALHRTRLDGHTQGQVEALLDEMDVAEGTGDVKTCQEHIAEIRRLLHLDH